MQARWSVAQILEMAPTAVARSAARRMANPGPWSERGSTDTLIWGSCQGSGRRPYQVVVELDGPVFRCSCPSRLQPCKHGLGLLLQWSAGHGTLGDGTPQGAHPGAHPGSPDWVAGRPGATAHGGAGIGVDGGALDSEEVARRRAVRQASAAERDALMTSGIADFARWLGDLARAGLGSARHQPYRYWDASAARLVDAKLPGLAERVRAAGGLAAADGDWAAPLLAEMGRWYAAIRAWEQRSPPEGLGGPDGPDGPDGPVDSVAADLATYVGMTRRRDDVVALGTTTGQWVVAGVRQGGDARLRNQRTWLIPAGSRNVEASGRPEDWVLLLDFAAAGAAMAAPAVVGSVLDVELARYPGSAPVRALFAAPPTVIGRAVGLGGAVAPIADALAATAAVVAVNPWRDRVPVALRSTRVVLGPDDGPWIVDEAGDGLPVGPHAPFLTLLAVTGGHPADVFGEIEGNRFFPMTVAVDDAVVDLG